MGRRGQEGGTAANPVADRREGKGRQGSAAKQQRGATANRREDNIVGGSEAGRQERYGAGVQGAEKAPPTIHSIPSMVIQVTPCTHCHLPSPALCPLALLSLAPCCRHPGVLPSLVPVPGAPLLSLAHLVHRASSCWCRPTCLRAVSATTLPCGRDGVPTPTGVPGCAAAGAPAAAPAGPQGGVESTGREGKGAQEGMGEDMGGRKKAGGERSTDHGRSGQGGGGMDNGAGHARGMGGAGGRGAAEYVGGSLEKAGEGGEGRAGRRTAQGTGTGELGGRRVAPGYSHSGNRLSRRKWRGRCRRGPGGRSEERQRGWRRGTGRWRRGSAGCRRRMGRWPPGHSGSSRTRKGNPPHGFRGTIAVRDEGQRGERTGWARAGKAAPGAGSRGSSGGTTAHQPQPGADADGPGLRVATTAAVCAAADAEGAGDSPGLESGGRGGAGPLREVGREDERGAGEARDPFLLRAGRQGGEATRKGAGDGGEQVEEDTGRGAPAGEPGVSPGTGEGAQGADAEEADPEGGMLLRGTMTRRRAGQERVQMGGRMQSQAHGCREGRRG